MTRYRRMNATHKRKNPFWLVQFARWIGKQRRLIINYRFYRALGHPPGVAWQKSGNTL